MALQCGSAPEDRIPSVPTPPLLWLSPHYQLNSTVRCPTSAQPRISFRDQHIACGPTTGQPVRLSIRLFLCISPPFSSYNSACLLPPPSIPMASVISVGLTKTIAELLLYGVYLVLFFAVVYLFRGRFLASKHRPVLLELGILFQFLTITAHLIASVVEAYSCLANTESVATAKICFLKLDGPSAVANTALFVIASLITDILVIHRQSVIWRHNWKAVAFPLFFLFAQGVGGVGVLVTLASETEGRVTLLSLSNAWVTTTLVASLVISLYCSGMIYWKISRIARQFNMLEGSISGGSRLMTVVAIIIESAGIQTSITVALLIAFENEFNGAAVMEGIGPAMFGISTVLIHGRVGLGWARQDHESTSSGEGQAHSARTLRLESVSRRTSMWP
ncbi:hypothetical protein MVEN_02501100 [Mycena venus]|uniref:Uncharacterized protein n=1 Tax=Mycena venus TaxID=2733690 RepID=A0A8H6U2Y9_9AGAR|nr:hypothetical protein MVEN_02501100 [Mycena venus]